MIDIVLCASGSDEVRIVHDLAQQAGARARVIRRCADLAETRGAAAAGIGDVVVIDLTVRGFDREVAAELLRAGVAVVGLRTDGAAQARTDLGLRHVVDAGAPVAEILAAIDAALGEDEVDVWTQEPPAPGPGEQERGRIVVVWGPAGSPGRSTLAANLAAESAAAGVETVLVDADTYAPSLAQMLGVLEEAPGLVAACRAAARDTLDARTTESLLPAIGPRLRLLTGIGVAARWAEVRPSGLEGVWSALRRRGALVVVDVAPVLEEDEELSYDTSAPQRNAAAISALQAADQVLAVVSAEPVGITRLIRERERLEELGIEDLAVVVNRTTSLVPAPRLHELIAARMPVGSLHALPEDAAACRRAAWDGTLLAESAPRSPLRAAIRELAATGRVRGETAPAAAGRPAASGPARVAG